ncbi:hypothetical protein RI129_002776 [Pyrocoelia pectoralis]|uniref:MADF domain-containing protein n=1 Tax=Pyrocoelia pectoralis TaxID=417401 RepID=A0AAN7VQ99_9COLE
MSDLRQISSKFFIEFIDVYRSLPTLWKIKSREYSDHVKKDKAYEQLLVKLKENCEEKEIDSLRSGYRRKLKKINESKRSANGSEDVYVPNLWYFDELSFLSDQEVTRSSVSNIDDQHPSTAVQQHPSAIVQHNPSPQR